VRNTVRIRLTRPKRQLDAASFSSLTASRRIDHEGGCLHEPQLPVSGW